MKKLIFIFSILLISFFGQSQDIQYARSIIDTLCSPSMHGRGYVNKGDSIAADFIANEFKNHKLKYFKDSYKQSYFMSINTFPYENHVKIDDKELQPGVDYFIGCGSNKIKGTYPLYWLDRTVMKKKRKFKKFIKKDYSNAFVVVDKSGITDKQQLDFFSSLKYSNLVKAKGIITIYDSNMVWTVADGFLVRNHTYLDCYRNCISPKSKKITLDISNEFHKNYKTQNVIGFVKGKVNPDSFLIFSAHYDHLGRMGTRAYFPGASDNASGTAMIIDLARHYSKAENQPDFSIVFIAYSGEEAGLLGSSYFAENPLVPIEKIKFILNLDMVGTGSKGIVVVNAEVLPKQLKVLSKLNDEKNYLARVKVRGESANSDHYPLYSKGVPAFFIYTFGNENTEYHTINDKAEILPLTEYEDLFKLLLDFIETF
ncbi:MAG: M20/M25/M40 family metallo-hydrolase [Saprospiraceae bacterium]|nr:M20/M25/M40 family metallo-hydrolase [Saprospiraceae bacterium]